MIDDGQEDFVELAFRYRNGLEKMYWLIAENERCECEFVPNWTEIMDRGEPHTSKKLRKHEHVCLHCKSEYIYAEAIGEEVFGEQMRARILGFLDSEFEDPVVLQTKDENGVEQYQIIEREDLDLFLEEHDDDEEE